MDSKDFLLNCKDNKCTHNNQKLVSEAQCYEAIRKLRWQEKISCGHCNSQEIIKRGYHSNQPYRQRYECKTCQKRFDDLSETVGRTPSALVRMDFVLVFYGFEFVKRSSW